MSLLVVLIILLLVFGVGSFPAFGYNSGWGYAPFGGIVGIVLVIILVLFVMGRL